MSCQETHQPIFHTVPKPVQLGPRNVWGGVFSFQGLEFRVKCLEIGDWGGVFGSCAAIQLIPFIWDELLKLAVPVWWCVVRPTEQRCAGS